MGEQPLCQGRGCQGRCAAQHEEGSLPRDIQLLLPLQWWVLMVLQNARLPRRWMHVHVSLRVMRTNPEVPAEAHLLRANLRMRSLRSVHLLHEQGRERHDLLHILERTMPDNLRL